ncbi:MAG: hypothetical protein N2259_01410 [Patescibacteria group bacterium]|nr:hypothetical protein [Patescibacteria group bacterium]
MVVQIKLAPWDKIFEFSDSSLTKKIKITDLKIGNWFVVKIDSHTDLGRIVEILEKTKDEEKVKEEKGNLLVRKANHADLKKMEEKKKRVKEILIKASAIVKKHHLPMKLIDAHLSLDAGQIVFAFSSAERIDFRNLVKDLSKEFHKSIRMHQVGPREEMKFFSGFGPCGQKLCCVAFLKNLGGVMTSLIKEQNLDHRGVERLSGLCGRLKCCLSFETEVYKELAKNFPLIGTKVKIDNQEGEVVGWHILKETVDLKIDQDKIIEVPLEKLKIKS